MRAYALVMLGVLSGAAGAAAQTGYRVAFPLEASQWQSLAATSERGVSILEYIPAGETEEGWSRFVSIQLFATATVEFPGADEVLGLCRRILIGRCPGAEWTFLSGGDQDRTYEWRIAGCDGEPDQHELGRVFRRGDAWARVTFSVKGRMDEETRSEWLRRLARARMVDEPR